jgi:hypothetical protein
MEEALQALANSPIAEALRRPGVAYPLLNAGHIFSLALLVGSVTILDLRLLGLFRACPLRSFAPPLSLMAAVGVAAALASGVLLFSVRPDEYAGNPAFQAKLVLVGLGVVNALIARLLPQWSHALAVNEVPMTLKLSAAVSLLIWPAALIAGRWIAFV